MSRAFLAVASGEHVERGRAGGFMQVCHGKRAPLRRMQPGDRVVYYSPTASFQGRDRLQAFTAIGVVKDGEPYPFDMGGGFRPFRRDVAWLAARAAPIAPLLARLEFSSGSPSWGARLRAGLLTISDRDMETIARAMGAVLPAAVRAA
ncbi:EVE domain-containing protein [Sorangium sp. So ce131]|uniref:EVE domain-containing protein n=1 Tax=Sorangium sp. So ce131 TaxID=3133282 RepID=UPI003F61887E